VIVVDAGVTGGFGGVVVGVVVGEEPDVLVLGVVLGVVVAPVDDPEPVDAPVPPEEFVAPPSVDPAPTVVAVVSLETEPGVTAVVKVAAVDICPTIALAPSTDKLKMPTVAAALLRKATLPEVVGNKNVPHFIHRLRNSRSWGCRLRVSRESQSLEQAALLQVPGQHDPVLIERT
jgi:hypothetical protein